MSCVNVKLCLLLRYLRVQYLVLSSSQYIWGLIDDACGSLGVSGCARERRVKGTVHPKMKILSSFTHPQLVPNLNECLCSAEHKGRYSEECGKQCSSGAPLTSIVFFFLYGSQWCPKTAWLQTFFKISSFVFSRTKAFIQVWNYLRMSKWWQNFHFFGWTIPLKKILMHAKQYFVIV